MSTLWCFGDSFTVSFNEMERKNLTDIRRDYIKWKGYVPKIYCEIIAEKFNMDLQMFATNGSDNYSIFENFCKVSDQIKKDDYIIFGWSGVDRFRLVGNNGLWKHLIPDKHFLDSININFISKTALEEIFVNRLSEKYDDEVNSWINLINVSFKDHVTHWTPFKNNLNVLHIDKFIFNTIQYETKGLVNDGHFSELGNKELSDALLLIIENKNKRPLI